MTYELFRPEALEAQAQLLHGHLDLISTEGLSVGLRLEERAVISLQLRNELADAIVELSALLDEIRFSGAFAGLLIEDYEQIAADDQPSDEAAGRQELGEVGMPITAFALLTPYFAPTPGPHTLFTQPHVRLAGDRVLSQWFAGQLIDASLVRVVAALDRVAIILWASAGMPIPVGKGTSHPAFRRFYLRQLAGHYPDTDLTQVLKLTEHELYRVLVSVRNGFTHSKRIMSELHGHYRVAYEAADPRGVVTQAIDKRTHLAILLACYNEVLRPAIGLASDCLAVPRKD